jgi:hypothetical protein
MTITHLDDEPLDTLHPLDLLERAVEANGWAFERAGRDELNLSVAGKWSDHHFNFSWREDLQSLHLSSAFDMRISEGIRRQNIADLLMHVNAKLWIGHFDLTSSMGITAEFHNPKFLDAMKQVIDAAKKHGKLAAIQPGDEKQAEEWIAMGFNVISWKTDIGVYRGALEKEIRWLRQKVAR